MHTELFVRRMKRWKCYSH